MTLTLPNMKLKLPKLVRHESGLFLPNRPKNEILEIASAKIEDVMFNGLDDFLNTINKEDFPFGSILSLKTTNYTDFHTGMRIPHPEDIIYFLNVGKVNTFNELYKKDVYIHYSPFNKTFGVTFSKQD